MKRAMRQHHRTAVFNQIVRRAIRHRYRDGGCFHYIWRDADGSRGVSVPAWQSGIHPPVKGKKPRSTWG